MEKEVRFPIAMLFVVLVAATAVALHQERLRLALAKAEGLVVANLILNLPGNRSPKEINYRDPNAHPNGFSTQDEEHEWWDKEKLRDEIVKAVPNASAVEQSGQYIAAQRMYDSDRPPTSDIETFWPWGFIYDVPMMGMGWLQITTGQPYERSFRDALKKHEQHRDGWWKSRRLKPASTGHNLYYLEAAVTGRRGDRMPLALKPPLVVFTNIEEKVNEDDDEYAVPGEIRAYYSLADSNSWTGPLTKAEIEAELLEACRAWGVITPSHNEAYLSLRSMFERQETPLPLLSLSVASDAFLLCSFAISIGLAAWASFLLRIVHQKVHEEVGAAGILVEPFVRIRKASHWDLIPACLELILFVAFHIAALSAPLLIGVIMINSGSPEATSLGFAMLLPAAILCISLYSKYIGIARSGWKLERAASPVASIPVNEKQPSKA